LKLVDKLWWSRFSLALATAAVCAYLSVEGFIDMSTVILAFLIAVFVYVLSYLVPRYILSVNPEQLPKKRDLALSGVFAYFISWFTFWIFFYTLAVWYTGMLGI